VLLTAWRTDKPLGHGYYLAVWRDCGEYTVSELWYSPSSGWFSSRGYLQQNHQGYGPIPVVAWMPLPNYPGTADPAAVDHSEKTEVYRIHHTYRRHWVIMGRQRMMANRHNALKIYRAEVKEPDWKDVTADMFKP